MYYSCCVDVLLLILTSESSPEYHFLLPTPCFSTFRDNTWLGFGLSGNPSRTQMFRADVSIVWVDENDGPQAVDYYLSAYTQVSNITTSGMLSIVGERKRKSQLHLCIVHCHPWAHKKLFKFTAYMRGRVHLVGLIYIELHQLNH